MYTHTFNLEAQDTCAYPQRHILGPRFLHSYQYASVYKHAYTYIIQDAHMHSYTAKHTWTHLQKDIKKKPTVPSYTHTRSHSTFHSFIDSFILSKSC